MIMIIVWETYCHPGDEKLGGNTKSRAHSDAHTRGRGVGPAQEVSSRPLLDVAEDMLGHQEVLDAVAHRVLFLGGSGSTYPPPPGYK